MRTTRPVVLCLSGHDPCGGAGVQADIEVLNSHACHAASVITAITDQDTHNVKCIVPQRAEDFSAQVETILADLPVAVIKIGLIGDHQLALAISSLLQGHPHIPVVFDPILAAGGGTPLADQQLLEVIIEQLLPRTSVLTPNSLEARKLSRQANLQQAGEVLLGFGCQAVLITGAHEDTEAVSNQLFQKHEPIQRFAWDRLPGEYHGSGCTLASSIAALLAQGLDIFTAVNEAQEYTWNALKHAYRTGQGQLNPNRLFWVDHED